MPHQTTPLRTGSSPRAADSVDLRIGMRVRQARRSRGLSQQALAEAAKISFQQVQKYERGVNRIAPSRLQTFADVLGVPPGWFFEGDVMGETKDDAADPFGALTPEVIETARKISRLPLPVQRRLMSLAVVLSEADTPSEPAPPLRMIS